MSTEGTNSFSDIDLFNCCTNGTAPDWSQFKSLETGGCITQPFPTAAFSDQTMTIGGIADDEAEFWTVYARHHSGEAEAITDCADLTKIRLIATQLSEISGLPVI